MSLAPPQSEEELLDRAHTIAGLRLEQLAAQLGWPMPNDLRHHKGWVGQLIEAALGATAGSLAEPDFQLIGVELKTLPIDQRGQPRESTYICTVPLESHQERWETSWVKKKLQRVLWMPMQAEPSIPLAQRHIGAPLLWSPSPEQEAVLRQDWEELMDMICLGELDKISARHGTWLQIRPKAANAKALTPAFNEHGERILTLPRGFYLRSSFTCHLLTEFYQ